MGGGLLDVVRHGNRDRYPRLWMYVVAINDYVHLAPFVIQEDGSYFLKTIIPNSGATREYRRRRQLCMSVWTERKLKSWDGSREGYLSRHPT